AVVRGKAVTASAARTTTSSATLMSNVAHMGTSSGTLTVTATDTAAPATPVTATPSVVIARIASAEPVPTRANLNNPRNLHVSFGLMDTPSRHSPCRSLGVLASPGGDDGNRIRTVRPRAKASKTGGCGIVRYSLSKSRYSPLRASHADAEFRRKNPG